MDVDKVLSKVRPYEYVSFDVFDTLLVRPYVRPHDLFRHIEVAHHVPGFAESRIRAESESRGHRGGETTLDKIYRHIDPRYSHLMDMELEFERRSICPPSVKDMFNSLCKIKKVVLLSDMYLPSGFISELLAHSGLKGCFKIYVSCEHGMSKGSGGLYGKVLEDLSIEPERLIHIGDNINSDCRTPKRLGISTVHVRRPIDMYLRENPLIRRYYRARPSLERSMVVSMDMFASFHPSNDAWYDITYRFGGPLVMDYCRFIERNVRPDDTIFFVARDGYNLKRIFDILHPEIRSEYVYAPRLLNILIGSNYRGYKKHQDIIVSHLYPEIEDDPAVFFEEHYDEICEVRERLFRRYRDTLGGHRSISLVDVTTMKYSSQKLIADLMGDADVQGIYYFILNNEPGIRYKGYHIRNRIVKLGDNINVTEFFLTSPEPPIVGIGSSGEPMFKDACEEERHRLDIYDSVTRAEVDYCVNMDRMFGKDMIDLGYDNIRDWLDVLSSPRDRSTRELLAGMKWPVDASHERYISIVYHPRDTWYHLRKTVLDSMWYVSKLLKGR